MNELLYIILRIFNTKIRQTGTSFSLGDSSLRRLTALFELRIDAFVAIACGCAAKWRHSRRTMTHFVAMVIKPLSERTAECGHKIFVLDALSEFNLAIKMKNQVVIRVIPIFCV